MSSKLSARSMTKALFTLVFKHLCFMFLFIFNVRYNLLNSSPHYNHIHLLFICNLWTSYSNVCWAGSSWERLQSINLAIWILWLFLSNSFRGVVVVVVIEKCGRNKSWNLWSILNCLHNCNKSTKSFIPILLAVLLRKHTHTPFNQHQQKKSSNARFSI